MLVLSLGAALALHVERTGTRPAGGFSPYLGPAFDSDSVHTALRGAGGVRFERCDDIEARLAQLLHQGLVVCRFAGRMEWGPRALGNRSILASPADAAIREQINVKVKQREEFRPFAPACLEEDFDRFFEGDRNPYMLMVNRARPEAAERLPAVVHFDGTARVSSASMTRVNPRFPCAADGLQATVGLRGAAQHVLLHPRAHRLHNHSRRSPPSSAAPWTRWPSRTGSFSTKRPRRSTVSACWKSCPGTRHACG